MCADRVANYRKCKKCGFKIQTDWKFCPNCADAIKCIREETAPAACKCEPPDNCGCEGKSRKRK